MTDSIQPVVELNDVSFRYSTARDGKPTLDRVSLRITADDFLGIVGPNGGGKTTLLKLILGLLKPQTGTVRVFGQSPRRVRNRIGYVPQQARIDATAPATVRDVVLMGRLSRSRWGCRYGKMDHDAVMHALERTGVADLAEQPIGALSGGQRQRVLLARALAADAGILLLDEPTANVDAHMESTLNELLVELHQSLPIVLVSHDVAFVSASLNKVACLHRTLSVHGADEITSTIIADMYHGPVRHVEHAHDCPVGGHVHDAHHTHAPS